MPKLYRQCPCQSHSPVCQLYRQSPNRPCPSRTGSPQTGSAPVTQAAPQSHRQSPNRQCPSHTGSAPVTQAVPKTGSALVIQAVPQRYRHRPSHTGSVQVTQAVPKQAVPLSYRQITIHPSNQQQYLTARSNTLFITVFQHSATSMKLLTLTAICNSKTQTSMTVVWCVMLVTLRVATFLGRQPPVCFMTSPFLLLPGRPPTASLHRSNL